MPTVRHGHIQQTILRILADQSPQLAGVVVEKIPKQLDLTEYEVETPGDGRAPRYDSAARWGSVDMKLTGWIDKSHDGWSITDEGRTALAKITDPGEFAVQSRKGYQLAKLAERSQDPALTVVRAVLDLIDAGRWVSIDDVADLAAVPPVEVRGYLDASPQEAGHRVLGTGGRPSDVSQRAALESEGIVFSDDVADPDRRLTREDLRYQLEEQGALPKPAQRAWLVRGANVNGRDLVPVWRTSGFVSLAASHLREVSAGISRDDLRVIIEEDYAHAGYSARAEKLDELYQFLTRMRADDLVATVSQGRLYLGELAGEAQYKITDDGRSNLRREVKWIGPDAGVDFADLPTDIATRLKSQHDVLDMTRELASLQGLIQTPNQTHAELLPELVVPDASAELAGDLNIDRAWLQEMVDLLQDRLQLIFYGPPGTGKTYVALKIAQHIAGDNVKLVQFHPAYSYEDFFEGYRPTPEGGFKLTAGPMRKIVDQALENPATPYVLIIDEINRGNLAKVFGELYFLLEYRDQSIDLMYAADDDAGFRMPENVFVIGTMNTADRSIALVDAAMRRRFAFVSLHPSEEPTSGLLARWLAKTGKPQQNADLLHELNRRIEDPDFKIGPSYLMRPEVYKAGGLERTWRTAIIPLLQEHHYGDGIDVDKTYGLSGLLAALAPTATQSSGESGEASGADTSPD